MPINRVDNAAYHHDLCYSKHSDNKTRNDVSDKTMLNDLDGIMNQTLREIIDKSTVWKFIKAKVHFGLDHPLKKKFNLLMSMKRNFTNQYVTSLREDGLMLMKVMKSGLLI